MRGLDLRLVQCAPRAGRYLLAGIGLGCLAGCCVIAQAYLLAGAITARAVPVALLVVVALRALLVWGQQLAAARGWAQVRSAVRSHLLARLLSGPADRPSGELTALVTKGVDALEAYVCRYLPQVVLALVVPLMVLAAVLWADLTSGLVVLVTLPLIPLFGALIGSWSAARTRLQWRTLELLSGHFADAVAGLPTLRSFRREHAQIGRVAQVTGAHRRATLRTLRLAFCSALVLELAATLSVAVVAVSVGLRLLAGHLPLHTALYVLILAPEAYLPLRLLGTHFHAAEEGVAATERIHALLDQPVVPPPPRPGGPGPVTVAGVVGRPGAPAASFTLTPGEPVLLTGPSGIGKSTLVAVLLGQARPHAGEVLAAVPPERIAWLPQCPHLEPGTIAANIALAVPAAPAEAVAEAAARCGLTGLDGPPALSAGQRQRLALARVVLRCALLDISLLLLDEPTAHLDPAAELDLRDVIAALLPGRAALIVTHRRALHPLTTGHIHLTARPQVPAQLGPGLVREG